MLSEIVFQSVLKSGLDSATKFLKEKKFTLDSSHQDLELAISDHLNQTSNWSYELNFKDLSKPKVTSSVFIDLEIFLMPRRNRIDLEEEIGSIPSTKIFEKTKTHIVILGQPGAGKTTLMKFICQSIFVNENFYPNDIKIPLLIRLRDLNSYFKEKNDKAPLVCYLFQTLGLNLNTKEKEAKEEDIELAKEKLLIPILEELKCVIILDGYDEIAEAKNKDKIIEDFKKLSLILNKARIILTSRNSDFNYSFENVSVLEICPLSNIQIKDFAEKWLENPEKTTKFLSELECSPFYDTAIRPLTLGHLCAIYERSGRIPDKPKTVYRKIISLLLEEWDEQRNVRRLTKYGSFEVDRKFEFLCRLSYELTINRSSTTFSKQILKDIYNRMYVDFNLEKSEVDRVVNELESHTGLILESGFDRYEFAHKSIQEFLCAEHLVKLPLIPNLKIQLLANELAIAVTISSNSSLYFCELVFNFFQGNKVSDTFISNFINRLVIEKPDFNVSKELSLALIVLYTIFRRGETNQLRLFDIDLPVQFEKFVNLIFKRNQRFAISKYYSFDRKDILGENDAVLRLRIIKPFSNIGRYRLPEYVYVKQTFIKEAFDSDFSTNEDNFTPIDDLPF